MRYVSDGKEENTSKKMTEEEQNKLQEVIKALHPNHPQQRPIPRQDNAARPKWRILWWVDYDKYTCIKDFPYNHQTNPIFTCISLIPFIDILCIIKHYYAWVIKIATALHKCISTLLYMYFLVYSWKFVPIFSQSLQHLSIHIKKAKQNSNGHYI